MPPIYIMSAAFVTGLQGGKWHGLAGYLAAVGLHAFLNLGAVLAQPASKRRTSWTATARAGCKTGGCW